MNEEEIRLIKGYFNDGYCCDLDELKNIANKMIKENETLQSKIDKANKYLEEHTDKLGKIRIPKIDFNYNELLDILKEVE